jgi:hypothetical protein
MEGFPPLQPFHKEFRSNLLTERPRAGDRFSHLKLRAELPKSPQVLIAFDQSFLMTASSSWENIQLLSPLTG